MSRPKYHFTAGRGWLNDPNGLVFLNGEYHLFFQHNPSDVVWGNMHWGHAVSRDLLHWKELPIALYPKENDFCFSGSAVVDVHNIAGFQAGSEPPLLVFFTSTGRGECLAYSNDGGRTFTEYSGNPVVRHRGRDPKVIYHEPARSWIMAVYDEVNHVAFHASKDLKHWTFQSRIHGFYECPDLFELNGRWVLMAANGFYSLGWFNGVDFVPDTLPRPLFYGDAYAGQTFSSLDRRVLIAWMRSDNRIYKGEPFCQQMTLPVELTLKNDRILVNPAVEVPGTEVYSSPDQSLTIEGITVPPAEHIEVIRDTMSVEIFVNHGESYYVKALPPAP